MKSPISGFLLAAAALLSFSSARAGVVINELMYHPASELNADEWIELFNNSAAPVDVSGWQFTSGVRFTIPAGTAIAAHGYLVVAANAAQFHTNYPAVVNYVGGWSGILSNSSDPLVLANASNVTENAIRYADDGDWGVRRRDYFADWGHRGWAWDSPADGGQNSTPVFQTGTDPFQKGKSLGIDQREFRQYLRPELAGEHASGRNAGRAEFRRFERYCAGDPKCRALPARAEIDRPDHRNRTGAKR